MNSEAVLKIKNKKGEADEEIKMFQSLVFGRSKNSNISIADEKISGSHCQITFRNDRMEITDLDSKNGTYLNGIRVENAEIFIGDEIRIGGTFITFNITKMTPDMIELLTFPGRFKDRINYELRIDFTGARVQNQLYQKDHPDEVNTVYQAKEIALRKKVNAKISFSKQEVRSQNKFLSMVSTVIDLMFLLILISLPLISLNNLDVSRPMRFLAWEFSSSVVNENRALIIACMEIVFLSFYFFSKMKMKYSFGEKIAGIEDLHLKQD